MPSTADLQDPKEYQKIFHWAETQKDATIPSFNTRKNDPYKVCYWILRINQNSEDDTNRKQYQEGFGNQYVAVR